MRAPGTTRTGPSTVPAGRLALAFLLLGEFAGVVDVFVVNVAAPSLQADLHAGFASLQLVVAGYTLAYAVGLVTGGRLGDRFGPRRVFAVGAVAFGAASAGCAAAPDVRALVGLRVVQGLAAAVLLPQVLTIIQRGYAGEPRSRALGLYGVTIGTAAVAGQLVGGGLLAWDPAGLGWRSIFLVNVPVCAVAVAGAVRTVPRLPGRARTRFDVVGVVLLGLGLAAVLYPVTTAARAGWTPAAVVEVGAGALLLAGFARWERRPALGAAALVPPGLPTTPGLRGGLGAAVFFYGGNAALVLVLTYLLQRGLGLPAWETGLAFVPVAVATAVASAVTPPLRRRFGSRPVLVGAALSVAGLLASVPVAAVLGTSPDTASGGVGPVAVALAVQPGLVLYGLGGGLVAPSIVGLSLAHVAEAAAGAASGVLLTVTQAAAALGVAALGALFDATYAARDSYADAFGVTGALVTAAFVVVLVTLARVVRP